MAAVIQKAVQRPAAITK